MKNKILTIILSLLLCSSIMVPAAENVQDVLNNTVNEEEITEDTSKIIYSEDANESSILSENQEIPYKQPIEKNKLIKKFLLAMLAVGVSSLMLYFGLLMYNRIRDGLPMQVKTNDGETPLSAPDDFSDAVKIFLEKTKWNSDK